MGLSVCPAAIVAAPIEVVWDLLRPARLSEWADGNVEPPVPQGPAQVGQRFDVTSKAFGHTWRTHFRVEKVDTERHQLAMLVLLPFGMQLHEHLSCTRIDATSCRVQYG
jgi:hypothetical protein